MKLGTKINLVLVVIIAIILTVAFWIVIDIEGRNLKQQTINETETVTSILLTEIEPVFAKIHDQEVSLNAAVNRIGKISGVKRAGLGNAENKYITSTDPVLVGQKIADLDTQTIIDIKKARKSVDIKKEEGGRYSLERYIPIFSDPNDSQATIDNIIAIEVSLRSKSDEDVRIAGNLLDTVNATIERDLHPIILDYNKNLAVLNFTMKSVEDLPSFHDFIIFNSRLGIITNTGKSPDDFSDDPIEYKQLREAVLAGEIPIGLVERQREGLPIVMRVAPITLRDEKTGSTKNVGIIEVHVLEEVYLSLLSGLKFRMLGVGIAFTAILVIVLAVILERQVVGPIRRFSVVAGKVSNGDLNQKIDHISNDEIGQFGDVFNSMVANLREFDRLKSDFVSVAAHQLRTPLSGVKWVLKLLIDGDLGPTTDYQKRMLERGIEANEKMVQLVNDLLNVSRIENGKFGYKFEKNDFAKFLKTLVGNTDLPSKERNIEVRLDMKGDPIPEFHFDPEKLLIALQNIVDNALKYTLPGGAVTIAVEKQGDYVEIKVTDTGVGIPKADLPTLFSKLFRAANVIHLQTDGSGLGLFISKSVILRHGGQIWVDSTEGKGTTITTVIPLKEELLPKETEGEGNNGIWKA